MSDLNKDEGASAKKGEEEFDDDPLDLELPVPMRAAGMFPQLEDRDLSSPTYWKDHWAPVSGASPFSKLSMMLTVDQMAGFQSWVTTILESRRSATRGMSSGTFSTMTSAASPSPSPPPGRQYQPSPSSQGVDEAIEIASKVWLCTTQLLQSQHCNDICRRTGADLQSVSSCSKCAAKLLQMLVSEIPYALPGTRPSCPAPGYFVRLEDCFVPASGQATSQWEIPSLEGMVVLEDRPCGECRVEDVVLVQNTVSSIKYFAKVWELKSNSETKQDEELLSSMRVQKWRNAQLRAPSLAKIFTVLADNRFIYAILERCAGQDLLSLIRQGITVGNESLARLVCGKLVEALDALHSNKVVYLDLCPETVVVCPETGDVKLMHFTLVKYLCKDHVTFGRVAAYTAPEHLRSRRDAVDRSVDWWTLGVLLHELLAGCTPFDAESSSAVFAKIVISRESGVILSPALNTCSPESRGLISSLLTCDPAHRLGSTAAGGVSAIKAHKFLDGFPWTVQQ